MMKRKILTIILVVAWMTMIVAQVVGASSESDSLRRGDIVYRSGAVIFGHPGIYIGDGKVIEVFPKTGLLPHGGAREITLDEFKKAGEYWGAKTSPKLDESKRDKIVEFVENAVWETKNGRIGYDYFHRNQKGGIGKSGRILYDSGGFAEATYESVGIDLVPGARTFLNFLTPKGQMKSSELIDVKSEIPKGKDLGGVNFSSITLNYISTSNDSFNYVMKAKKAQEGDETIEIEEGIELSLNFFLVGLTLPNRDFWVNLNPWEPARIVDDDVGRTDVGKIMLEADLQMKKDFCKYENPCSTKVGEDYWQLLEKEQEELVTGCMQQCSGELEDPENVLFQAATRHWIVPDEVTAHGNENEVYIVNSTLAIKSEPVYEHATYEIVNQDTSKVSDGCHRCLDDAVVEYGKYATEMEEEMIYPLVAHEVNNNANYSELRQVYVSLALAQWYKSHGPYDSMIFSDFIGSEDLEGLESENVWDATEIWEGYVKSYNEGEYKCQKDETYRQGDYIITESKIYSSGGVDFEDIEITNVGGIPSNLKELTSEAVYSLFTTEGDDYYFGDGIYVSYESLEPVPQEDENKTGITLGTEVDSDGDGWSDEYEQNIGTNPYIKDTDNDGLIDSQDPNPRLPEEKDICGPTAIVLLAMLPMFGAALLRKKNKRKIIES